MRGLFTAGVLDVFMERDVKFDGLVGVSAGACFGCNYKSGQAGRVIRYNKRFARDPRYCSWRSLLATGDLFGAETRTSQRAGLYVGNAAKSAPTPVKLDGEKVASVAPAAEPRGDPGERIVGVQREAEVGRRERREHRARERRLAERHSEERKRHLVYLPVRQEYEKLSHVLQLKREVQGTRRTNTALWSEMRSAGTTTGGPCGVRPRETT